MITQTESGLTEPQYMALVTAQEGATWKLVAHRYNLRFQTFSNDSGALGKDFASCVHHDKLYRLAANSLRVFEDLWQVATGFTAATGVVSGKPPALVSDGTHLAAFYQTSTGISRWIDAGVFFPIVADVNVDWIAAVSPTRIHFITNEANDLHRLKVAEYNGSSWVITGSDIYYPYPIAGMTAASKDGVDVVVLTTQVPGALSTKLVNNQAVNTILQSGGLIAFTYKNGTWSDHYEIDVLDELHEWRFRLWPRLTIIDDTLFLTCYFGDGTERTPYGGYRLYRSKDLRHWTRGEVLVAPEAADMQGVELHRIDNTVYLVEKGGLYLSASTLLTGLSTVTQDISIHVEDYTLTHSQMLSAQITLNNESNWLSASLLNGENQVWLEHLGGYWVDGEKLIAGMGFTELDAVQQSNDLTDHMAQLVSRDQLAWMSDRTQSEQFHNWESQLVAGDDFVDDSDTNYAGLGHTAAVKGSFQTPQGQNKLAISTSNEECIALSTWKTDLWNGQHSGIFRLATTGNEEFAGLAFRTRDQDNGFFLVYYQQTDHLKLFYRKDGNTASTLWESGDLGWDNDLDEHGLMVLFYYGQIKIFTSADGIMWTLIQTVYEHGQSGDDPILQAASCGWIGRGYAPDDTWTIPDPFPFPIFPFPVFPYDGTGQPTVPVIGGDGGPPLDGPTIPATSNLSAAVDVQGNLVWTEHYNTLGAVSWHTILRANWTSLPASGFAYAQWKQDPDQFDAAIGLMSKAVYRISGLYSGSPHLTKLVDITASRATQIAVNGSTIFVTGDWNQFGQNLFHAAVSLDRGGTWSQGRVSEFQVLLTTGTLPGAAIGPDGETCYLGMFFNVGGTAHARIGRITGGDIETVEDTTIETHFNIGNAQSNRDGSLLLVNDYPVSSIAAVRKRFDPGSNILLSFNPIPGVGGSPVYDFLTSTLWWARAGSGNRIYRTVDAGGTWVDLGLANPVDATFYTRMLAADLDGNGIMLWNNNKVGFFDGIQHYDRTGDLALPGDIQAMFFAER